MQSRADRLVLRIIQSPNRKEGGRDGTGLGADQPETRNSRQRTTVPEVLQADLMTKFFVRYVKGRVFEWAFALAMLLAGVELLIWNEVLTFGAFRWLLLMMSQKWIGIILFLTGWTRISALMFNGQKLLGYKIGPVIRAACAVVGACLWTQFTMALIQLSIMQGFPSIGLPFWSMFIIAELLVAYAAGTEWKT